MDYVSIREIVKMFYLEDKDTIVRKPNLRRFIIQENIPVIKSQKGWFVDINQLFMVLNPKGLKTHEYHPPIIRNLSKCVKIWNKKYPKPRTFIDKHAIEKILKETDVFRYKLGYHSWLINYTQVEKNLLNRYFSHNKQ